MLTQADTDQSQPAGAKSPQTRWRRYFMRRGRQLSLAVLFLAMGLLFAAGVVVVWHGAGVIRLPDVGDPFDVAALRALRVPADQDAFALIKAAQDRLAHSRMPALPVALRRRAVSWSEAPPELRTWAKTNRDVLELFRQAADRPDGILHPPGDQAFAYNIYLGDLNRLALLEASRLEEQGDMSGACAGIAQSSAPGFM